MVRESEPELALIKPEPKCGRKGQRDPSESSRSAWMLIWEQARGSSGGVVRMGGIGMIDARGVLFNLPRLVELRWLGKRAHVSGYQ